MTHDYVEIDIESYSEVNLKDCGVYKYAEDPSTEVLCLAYSFGGPVTLWIPGEPGPHLQVALIYAHERIEADDKIVVQPGVPDDLHDHIIRGGRWKAHNAQFERVVLNGVAGKKIGFPLLKIKHALCTAAKMRAHGLPGDLKSACEALGTRPKNDFGHGVMLQLCRPRTGEEKRYLPADEPEKYGQLWAYCIDDVKAEHGIDEAVPDLSAAEQLVWEMDQRINNRGIRVDVKAIADVQALIAEYKKQMEDLCLAWTGLRPSQREKLSEWVRTNGYPHLISMEAESVNLAVADSTCPEGVKKVLKLYSTYGMKAVSKFDAMLDMMCLDHRLRGMFLYHGAGTGRWSSLGVQLQNLARPSIKDPESAIEAFKTRDLEWVKMLFEVDPMKTFASCVRGMLIPAEGHDIQAIDLAGIESRLTAWVFDEKWKIRAFAEKDAGIGPDTYSLAYAKLFNVDVKTVTPDQRQIGKCIELAAGFEGGVGAFVTMAATYKVDLDEMAEKVYPSLPAEVLDRAFNSWDWAVQNGKTLDLDQKVWVVCESLKLLWRENHPAHVQGWAELLEAAKAAVKNPGQAFQITSGLIKFKVSTYKGRQWLYMRLPSGRRLAYFSPRVEVSRGRPPKGFKEIESNGQVLWVKFDANDDIVESRVAPPPRETLTYMGVDTNTRRWMRVGTYGGRLTQNGPGEGIARDLLVNGMHNLEAAGYPGIGSVHDEFIMEPKVEHGSLEQAKTLFLRAPEWAKGLPLNAEGFRARRYRK